MISISVRIITTMTFSVTAQPPEPQNPTRKCLWSPPAGERGSIQRAPAGGDAPRRRRRDALPVGEELCPQGPGGPERAGQLQPGVQSVRLWPVPSHEGHGPQRANLHRLPGTY